MAPGLILVQCCVVRMASTTQRFVHAVLMTSDAAQRAGSHGSAFIGPGTRHCDKPKKQNCFCEIVNKYRPRKQRFQGAPSPAEPWVFVCLRMICVREKRERWVLLKRPRCDIDGVGEKVGFNDNTAMRHRRGG